jgi:hypothetical protein
MSKWSEKPVITGTTSTSRICLLDGTTPDNKTILVSNLFKNTTGTTEFDGPIILNKETYHNVYTLELSTLERNEIGPEEFTYTGNLPKDTFVVINDNGFVYDGISPIYLSLPALTTDGLITTIKNPLLYGVTISVTIPSNNIVYNTNNDSTSEYNLNSGQTAKLIYSNSSWYVI